MKKIAVFLEKFTPVDVYLALFFSISLIINSVQVQASAKRKGLKLLKDTKLNRTSDTVFILGSGGSINAYSQQEWDHIRQHDTIGFNFWLLHDFVPNLYVYEENIDPSRNELFYNILKKKELDYKNVNFVVKDVEYKGVSDKLIPAGIKKNVIVSVECILPGSEPLQLSKNLGKLIKYYSLANRSRLRCLPKRSGSLSYLLFLAAEMGYKKIVLCGVDLYNSDYFYYSEKYNDYVVPKQNYPVQEQHPTNSNQANNIPIADIIQAIDKEVLKKRGIELFIAKKSSALYPNFKHYFN